MTFRFREFGLWASDSRFIGKEYVTVSSSSFKSEEEERVALLNGLFFAESVDMPFLLPKLYKWNNT